jgi:hypothetical protein
MRGASPLGISGTGRRQRQQRDEEQWRGESKYSRHTQSSSDDGDWHHYDSSKMRASSLIDAWAPIGTRSRV